jgi:uncharacterized OsmC-like protein
VFEFTNDNGEKCFMDASPEIGGKNKGFRPMELLAGSLVGCLSIDVIAILNKKRIEPTLYEMKVNGTRNETIPRAFNAFEIELIIDKSIDLKMIETILQLVNEKYCSVSATLNKDIAIDFKITQK